MICGCSVTYFYPTNIGLCSNHIDSACRAMWYDHIIKCCWDLKTDFSVPLCITVWWAKDTWSSCNSILLRYLFVSLETVYACFDQQPLVLMVLYSIFAYNGLVKYCNSYSIKNCCIDTKSVIYALIVLRVYNIHKGLTQHFKAALLTIF